MKRNFYFALTFVGLAFMSCSDDEGETPDIDAIVASDVISNYADVVLANYTAALADAEELETAINTFTADPTETNFDAAKDAWLNARESYGPSEAFRFANGPIDSGDTEEIEGYLNSWPMDEAFVDYVDGNADAGIINNATAFPDITKDALVSENGNGGEENVAIGYHAIEFLLWGQDLTTPSDELSGQRVYTDFVDGGTAANQDRRRAYLDVVADLLTDHLQVMVDEWSGDYKTTFLALDESTALNNIISSISELSRSELAIERMAVALQNQDQEDEHSCFSDNTHRDIRLNLAGIINVYEGTYGTTAGASLKDLITQEDPTLATELNALLVAAETTVDDTLIPFDLAIAEGATGTEGTKVQLAVEALVDFGDKLLDATTVLGL